MEGKEEMEMELSTQTLRSILRRELLVADCRKDALSSVDSIDYIKEPISYDDFFRKYLLPNKLCVLGAWATAHWTSRKEWVSEDGTLNLAFLKAHFGRVKCPVANCNEEKYKSHPKCEMLTCDFLDYLKDCASEHKPESQDCLYLKDWHFQKLFPQYEAYEVPAYFLSDWMNEFWDERDDTDDDYRFVYIGPKGSWTPFHSDVFRSFSWSANICGRKKWIFFPPGEERHLKDRHGQLIFDLNSPELEDRSKFPAVDNVQKKFEVYQETGEVVFVPSGWHHQVFNLEDTISINHNWLNGCNAELCWLHLVDSLRDVQKEIEDCRDMEGWGQQCQLILKSSSGMDYAEFYRFLCTIAESRISSLDEHLNAVHKNNLTDTSCGDEEVSVEHSEPEHTDRNPGVDRDTEPCPGEGQNMDGTAAKHEHRPCNHHIFDLFRIKELVCQMKQNKEFLELDFEQFEKRPKKLVDMIKHTLARCMEYFIK